MCSTNEPNSRSSTSATVKAGSMTMRAVTSSPRPHRGYSRPDWRREPRRIETRGRKRVHFALRADTRGGEGLPTGLAHERTRRTRTFLLQSSSGRTIAVLIIRTRHVPDSRTALGSRAAERYNDAADDASRRPGGADGDVVAGAEGAAAHRRGLLGPASRTRGGPAAPGRVGRSRRGARRALG